MKRGLGFLFSTRECIGPTRVVLFFTHFFFVVKEECDTFSSFPWRPRRLTTLKKAKEWVRSATMTLAIDTFSRKLAASTRPFGTCPGNA